MSAGTVAVRLDESLIRELDRLIRSSVYPSRDRAIEDALREKLHRLRRPTLAEACEKLDPAEERAMAEEGLVGEATWPEY